jgi:hypothetical protein
MRNREARKPRRERRREGMEETARCPKLERKTMDGVGRGTFLRIASTRKRKRSLSDIKL